MKEPAMTMLVGFVPESVTVAQYDETIKRLSESRGFRPDGCEYRVAFFVDGKRRVSEIWESQEKFGERLMPVLAEGRGQPPAGPENLDVHNTISRWQARS
jgi:hypothetical protein